MSDRYWWKTLPNISDSNLRGLLHTQDTSVLYVSRLKPSNCSKYDLFIFYVSEQTFIEAVCY